MTKSDVASAMAAITGRPASEQKEAIDAFTTVLREEVQKGNSVFIRGFGTFTAKLAAAKTARNISKGTEVKVPARLVPRFKPCAEFKRFTAKSPLER